MLRLFITANLGRVRVLHYSEPGDDPCQQPHWHELPNHLWQQPTPPLRQQVTDQAGRFAQGASASLHTGMSTGEEHQLIQQIKSDELKHIVSHIETILEAHHYPAWILAAPSPIHHALKAQLSQPCRNQLLQEIHADLTRSPIHEIERLLPN